MNLTCSRNCHGRDRMVVGSDAVLPSLLPFYIEHYLNIPRSIKSNISSLSKNPYFSSDNYLDSEVVHFWRFSLLPFQSYWTWYDEHRIATLCRMLTWVVFLRMFWNSSNNSGTAKVKIVKNERVPLLFTSKQLIQF
jgi:hypothetical protein